MFNPAEVELSRAAGRTPELTQAAGLMSVSPAPDAFALIGPRLAVLGLLRDPRQQGRFFAREALFCRRLRERLLVPWKKKEDR
jgi:hypothetical protein